MSTDSHIKTRITNEKIKIASNIDLNALFNLNYNFDLLKGIIEELLKNQEALQNQMDDIDKINQDKDDRIAKLEKEIERLKESQIEKSVIEQIQNDLNEIKKHLIKHDDQIDDIYDKLKKLTERVDAHDQKLKDLEELKNIKSGNEDAGVLATLIKQLENKTDSQYEKLKKMIEDLTNEHNETVKKVTYNKEQIDILFARLGDIVNDFKAGDKTLQEQVDELRKYIDDKLIELNAQLELLSSKPGEGGKISDGDLKIIKDLIKRLTQLENNFNDLMRRTNDLVQEVDSIRREIKDKANNKDLDDVKRRLDALQKELEELKGRLRALDEKVDGHDKDMRGIKEKIRELNELFNKLKTLLDTIGTKGGDVNIDMSKYVQINQFNEYKNETNDKFNNVNDEIEKIHKLIEQILSMLNNKADKSDLANIHTDLLNKIEELAIACNKKFADKNETARNLKYLETQIKKILAMLDKKDVQGENWLLAKKPLSGFSCASCEAYIGELHDNTQYVPWNKYPLRDPNEKLYRIGNGFSKMLQMLNVDGGTNNNTTENNNSFGPGNQTAGGFYQKREFNGDIDNHKVANRVQSAMPNKVRGLPKVYGQQQVNNEKKEYQMGSSKEEEEEGPHM